MPNLRCKASPFRCWTFISATLGTIAIIAIIIATLAYTGAMPDHAAYDLVLRVTMLTWVAFLAAFVRDEIVETLKPMKYTLEDIETEVVDYGDAREAAGQQIAISILRPGHKSGGRHLRGVE